MKSDGYPTYHFANVVDDYLMNITHVIRGDEWLPSTPKHVLLYEMLGLKENMPLFAHLPVITDLNGKKLSKRFESVSVENFREEGFLPQALVNGVALLGWTPPSHDNPTNFDLTPKEFIRKEVYSLKELESFFMIQKLTKRSAKYDK